MGFCTCSAKFILFFFNLICAFLGLAVLGIGVYGFTQGKTFNYYLQTPSILLIVFGGVIFLVAFFGCWGALQEDRTLLNIYGIILFTLLLALIAIGAYVHIKKDDTKKDVKHFIEDVFTKAKQGDVSSMSIVDLIQGWNHCCGLDGPTYWGDKIPKSCCKNNDVCDISNAYKAECQSTVLHYLVSHIKLLGNIAIVTGCVELLAVFFSFYLAHSIRRAELRNYT